MLPLYKCLIIKSSSYSPILPRFWGIIWRSFIFFFDYVGGWVSLSWISVIDSTTTHVSTSLTWHSWICTIRVIEFCILLICLYVWILQLFNFGSECFSVIIGFLLIFSLHIVRIATCGVKVKNVDVWLIVHSVLISIVFIEWLISILS